MAVVRLRQMTKGIAVECTCCGTTQEVSSMVAHDIFGFSLAQVQHILHDYREQVPHAEAMQRRLQFSRDTRLIMMDLLCRAEKGEDIRIDFAQLQKNLKSED